MKPGRLGLDGFAGVRMYRPPRSMRVDQRSGICLRENSDRPWMVGYRVRLMATEFRLREPHGTRYPAPIPAYSYRSQAAIGGFRNPALLERGYYVAPKKPTTEREARPTLKPARPKVPRKRGFWEPSASVFTQTASMTCRRFAAFWPHTICVFFTQPMRFRQKRRIITRAYL